MACTSLDHVYRAAVPGTPCYCGKRTWAGAPRAAAVLKNGQRVALVSTGAHRTIVEKLRGEDVYRVDAPAGGGRTLFDRDELQLIGVDKQEAEAHGFAP